jgi:two-component system, sensor histidine kinase and response regulator
MTTRNDSPSVAAPPSGGAPPASAEPILEQDAMLATVEHDLVLLRELVELFFAEAPGLLAQIRSGLNASHKVSVERAAHTLKGALSNFGARRACAKAREVELHAHEARLDEAGQQFPALETEVAQACRALSDYLREATR